MTVQNAKITRYKTRKILSRVENLSSKFIAHTQLRAVAYYPLQL